MPRYIFLTSLFVLLAYVGISHTANAQSNLKTYQLAFQYPKTGFPTQEAEKDLAQAVQIANLQKVEKAADRLITIRLEGIPQETLAPVVVDTTDSKGKPCFLALVKTNAPLHFTVQDKRGRTRAEGRSSDVVILAQKQFTDIKAKDAEMEKVRKKALKNLPTAYKAPLEEASKRIADICTRITD